VTEHEHLHIPIAATDKPESKTKKSQLHSNVHRNKSKTIKQSKSQREADEIRTKEDKTKSQTLLFHLLEVYGNTSTILLTWGHFKMASLVQSSTSFM
jgi:hypothetical protein